VALRGAAFVLTFSTSPCILQAGFQGARRMSEPLLCSGVTAKSSGRRVIAHALLISLCVHAALVGVFWRYIATHSQPAPRELRVELSAVAHSANTVATASMPAPPVNGSSTHLSGAHPVARLHPRVAVVQPAVPLPAPGEVNEGASHVARDDDSPPQIEAAQSQRGMVSIDVRVLDWLARYRTYPLAARRAHIEGVVQMRVTLMPDGRLVDARVERSSGHPVLDAAALDLLARAAPLPSEYGSARNEQIELQLPIVYRMRATST
jgi:protein TonB